MATRFAISGDVAWLEALEGGRLQRKVWIADVKTGDHFTLEDTGWLVWILLDEGATTTDEVIAAAAAAGAGDALTDVDLPAFLDLLVKQGVITTDPDASTR